MNVDRHASGRATCCSSGHKSGASLHPGILVEPVDCRKAVSSDYH